MIIAFLQLASVRCNSPKRRRNWNSSIAAFWLGQPTALLSGNRQREPDLMWRGLSLVAICALSLQPQLCGALGSTPRLHGYGVLGSAPRLRGGAKQQALVPHRARALVAAADCDPSSRDHTARRARVVLEVGALFAACVSLSLLSDTLTKKILQQDRSLTVTVTFFHFAMSALGGAVVVPTLAWLARSNPASEDGSVTLPPLSRRDAGILFPLVCCQVRSLGGGA